MGEGGRLAGWWHASALIMLAAVTLLFTWPLALRMRTDVIGPARADNLEYVWKLWWVPHAITQGGDPFFNPAVAYPAGYPMAYGEISPAHTFLYAPVTLALGEVTAYNLAIFASFILTGAFAYGYGLRLLARLQVTGGLRFTGALLASLAFTFCAYRMARTMVHLNLVDTQWLVLAFWMLDRWLERREIRAALVVGAALGMAGLSSWYYLFMLGLLIPVYTFAFVGWRGVRDLVVSPRAWWGALAGGAVLALLVVPFLIPYLEVARDGAAVIPLADTAFWSASLADYIVPNPRHPLWGGAVQALIWPFDSVAMPLEFMLAVGWITLFLALVGWRRVRGPSFRAWKWTIAAAVVLSIGRLTTPIPLPALLLREFMPFAEGVRAWGRFAIFAMLGLSLLAGASAVVLLAQKPVRTRRAWGMALCASVLFAAWPGPAQLITVGPRAIDVWLADQPGSDAVMEYPLNVALSGPAMLGTRFHDKPVVFGYGTYYPYLYRERYPELLTFPEDAALDRLAEWGVRYIAVHTDALTNENFTIADALAQPRLRAAAEVEGAIIFELES